MIIKKEWICGKLLYKATHISPKWREYSSYKVGAFDAAVDAYKISLYLEKYYAAKLEKELWAAKQV